MSEEDRVVSVIRERRRQRETEREGGRDGEVNRSREENLNLRIVNSSSSDS
jgi:hypothetical protein